MKKLLLIPVIFLLMGCATYEQRCCTKSIELLQSLNCEDSMFIGYLSAVLPAEQWQTLTKGYRKAIFEKRTGCGGNKAAGRYGLEVGK